MEIMVSSCVRNYGATRYLPRYLLYVVCLTPRTENRALRLSRLNGGRLWRFHKLVRPLGRIQGTDSSFCCHPCHDMACDAREGCGVDLQVITGTLIIETKKEK